MTIFGNRKTLPPRTAMMLLERFVWQGWAPVQQAALALLKLAEPVIMRSDFETIIKGLQEGSIFLGSASVGDLTEGRTGGFTGRGVEDSFDEYYDGDWSHGGGGGDNDDDGVGGGNDEDEDEDEDDEEDEDSGSGGGDDDNGVKKGQGYTSGWSVGSSSKDTSSPKKDAVNDMLAAILNDPDVFASMCDGYAKEGVDQECLQKLEKEYEQSQKGWFGGFFG